MTLKQHYIAFAFLIVGTVFPVIAPAQELAKGSASYQSLIRKNFELRNELKVLDEKYQNLENERKVLILHVKELQDSKALTASRVQDLKNMVASLRIEMNKDPKLTSRIDGLVRRINAAVEERDALQVQIDQLELEKKSFDRQRDENLEMIRKTELRNEQMAKEIEELRAGYDRDEGGLKDQIRNKEEELGRLKIELGDMDDQVKQLKEDVKKAETMVGQRTKKLEVKLSKALDEKNGLEERIQLGMAEKDKERLSRAESENALKDQVKEKQDEISRIRNDMKDMVAKVDQAKEDVKKTETMVGQRTKELESKLSMAQDKAQQLAKELEDEKAALDRQKRELKGRDNEVELKNQQLVKELKQESSLLKEAEGKWQAKVKAAEEDNKRLEKELMKVELANESLNKKLVLIEKEIQESGEINRQLMKDLKKEQMVLEKTDKALKLETQKRAIEKETFDARMRNAMKDKALLEAKVAAMEASIHMAQAKHDEALKESKVNSTMVDLKESQIAALREEKSRLEKKLVRYIEKIVMQSETMRAPGGIGQTPETELLAPGIPEIKNSWKMPRAERISTKKEIAEKKLKMHYNLALAYDKMNMFKEEEREYLKCLKINRKDANVHYNMAILYDDKLNKNGKAIAHYKKYLELRPQGEEAISVKHWILYAEQEERLGTITK